VGAADYVRPPVAVFREHVVDDVGREILFPEAELGNGCHHKLMLPASWPGNPKVTSMAGNRAANASQT
jgi:hypothetical protein